MWVSVGSLFLPNCYHFNRSPMITSLESLRVEIAQLSSLSIIYFLFSVWFFFSSTKNWSCARKAEIYEARKRAYTTVFDNGRNSTKAVRCKKFSTIAFVTQTKTTKKKSTRAIGWRRGTRPAKRNRASKAITRVCICIYTRYLRLAFPKCVLRKEKFSNSYDLRVSVWLVSWAERNFFRIGFRVCWVRGDRSASEMCVEIRRNGMTWCVCCELWV